MDYYVTAEDAAQFEEIRTEERERCCKDICSYCEQGMDVWRQNEKVLWIHTTTGVRCLAAPIRERSYRQAK